MVERALAVTAAEIKMFLGGTQPGLSNWNSSPLRPSESSLGK